jgi:cell division protease FtsH
MVAGWQATDHEFTDDFVQRIAVHEMGHAVVGFLAQHHPRMTKVILNPSSPKSPGYTLFARDTSKIFLKESLFEHLVVLLSGRIAEEVIFNCSITSGAVNDLEEAMNLAQKMILNYGMGAVILYPRNSEKYKAIIDDQVAELLNQAYGVAKVILSNCMPLLRDGAEQLREMKCMTADDLEAFIDAHYPHVDELRHIFNL